MEKLHRTFARNGSIALFGILIFVFLTFVGSSGNAEELKKARISQVIQDVRLLGSNAAARPAAVNDNVGEGMAVRTGGASRAELTFTDLTITRLGENTVFSFKAGTRELNLSSGAVLLEVPPKGAAVKISTAAVTAAITGGTALFSKGPPTKFMVLEGTGTFYPAGHPEEAVTLHGGEMVMMTADGHITQPAEFDVKLVLETSHLIIDFPDLANLPLILAVMNQQLANQSAGPSSPPPNNIVNVISLNTVANPNVSGSAPGPTGPPSEFGPPTTITSPDPYVITSGTQINTGPTITTNGVTDFGKIYRGPALDGSEFNYLFGSTSSFDMTIGEFFNTNGNGVPVAVFKFSSLELTGNPTITIPSGATTFLGLVSVGDVTSAAPAGTTLTFAGLDRLFIATQSGSITLGPEIAFSGIGHVTFYARGSGSNLTLGSAISGADVVHLFSEGTVQVNGDITVGTDFKSFSGGDFLAGSGKITAQTIDIESLSNLNINASQFPNPPTFGGSVNLIATNTLNLAIDRGGGFGWDTLTAQANTINITSSTPTTFDFSNSSSVTFTAGTGGIQAPNIAFSGSNLSLMSGADINVGSIAKAGSGADAMISAATSFNASGDVQAENLTAGTTVNTGGFLVVYDTLTAGGNITVGDFLQATTINAPSSILTVQDEITPNLENAGAALQHTFNIDSIVSPNGIVFSGNQFDGRNGLSSGGLLTINANTLTFDSATGIAFANFNGADAGSFSNGGPASGGDGGIFIVNTTGNLTANNGADIMATTGLNTAAGVYSGAGGSVTLHSSGGMVTVNDTIQVSSDDSSAPRQSASGGTILLRSNLTTGPGITVGANAQLLSLLNANAPGPGGSITLRTFGADINILGGTIEADRGTITITQEDPVNQTPVINVDGATLTSEILSIVGAGDVNIGLTNPVTINTGTISLFAPGSIVFDYANSLSVNGFDAEAGGASDAAVVLSISGDFSDSGNSILHINNNGGAIGSDAVISMSANNLSAGYLEAAISNHGGNIAGSANVNFNVSGNLTTTQSDVFFDITNRNGGTIGSNASINVTAASLPTGFLESVINNNANGLIRGNATATVNVSGDINAATGILAEIVDTGFQNTDNTFTGGTIGGSATVTLQGQNIITPSTATGVPGTDTMALEASIYTNVNGTVGGDATVNVTALQDLSAAGTALFWVANGNYQNLGPGHIGGSAAVNVSAANISTGDFFFQILNYGGSSIGQNAILTLHALNSLNVNGSINALIDNNGGTIGGNATINMNLTNNTNLAPTATVSGDVNVQIVGNDPVGSAAINFNGGDYTVGGTFLSTIDGDGTITFSNADVHADMVKIGVFGTNGTLMIGGGSITGDTALKLYAPGSNGSIDFTANVTLTSPSTAAIIAANKVTIFNGVTVTIGGTIPASVYTNIANYTGSGGNGSTTGMFGGAGAVTSPLSQAPAFNSSATFTITYLGAPAGNWSDPASWNPSVVPNNSGGNTYNAVQSSGMLIQDIVAGVTIEQFQMSGGTLRLDNPLTLNAGLQFSGGTINSGNLFIAGSSNQSATMGVNGTTITNSGTYNITLDGSDLFAGSATFNNSGTLSKTTGAGTDNFNIALNNSGTVSAQNGTLRFVVGETSAGAFSASAGATVEFASNWTFTNGAAFSGAGTIQLDNGTTTNLSGTITNSGTILLNSTVNFTDLRIAEGTTLTGGGSVILSDSPNNRIYGTANSGTETLTNVNNTISGAGQIGISNSIEFINQSAGVIDATSATNALVISPTTQSAVVNPNGGGFVNQGLLEATAAGGLVLNSGQFNNKGATIEAIGSGNNVYLENSVTISGGTLSDSGGGLIETVPGHSAFLDGTSQGALTIAGTYQVTNNSTTFLNGTINNTGTISINSGANFTDLRIADGTTLTGGGNVILSDSPFNRIYGTTNSGAETLTNVNNTISGAGQIGVSNSIEFINQSAGVIDATSANNALIITPTTNSTLVNANGGGFVNQGLLEATAAGGLVLYGGQFNNKGGMIEAVGSGNNVYLENGVIISGGTLTDSGGGLIQTASGYSATLDGTSQGTLTIVGTYQGSNSSATFLNGTINNTGTISINSTASFTDLLIADGTILTGGGSLILSDSPNNRIYGTTNSGAETLTNVNNTISGAGQIGISNSIEFINQSAGVIDATSATNALVISPTTQSAAVSANGGGFVNQGLLEATAAGGLVLYGGQFNNNGATIEAIGSGNNVYLENGVIISGGTLTDSGGGLIQTASGYSATLDGTSQGTLTIVGTYQGSNSSATFLNGTINNTGTILLNSTGNFTDLLIADGTTLTGGGSLILSDSPNNRIYGATNSGTETLTNVNNTISGAGQIGISNSIEFINQSAGVIDATSATNSLIISPTTQSAVVNPNGGGFVNQGLLEATAVGGLVLYGGQFNNKGGMIEAIGSGNNVYLENGVIISGGTLTDSGGGLIQTASGYSATLDGTSQGTLTIAGTYQGSNASTTFLNGTINNTGTISINSTGNFTDLRIADGTTLTGGGSVILSDSPNNRIYGATNSGAETVTNVNNTISGAGQIGVSNSIEFINQSAGVINANSSSNALIITPTTNSTVVSANGGGFVNQGLLEATAAGGLVLSSGQFNNNGGTIQAIGSGNNVYLENGVTVSGGTLSGSSGGLIETATGHSAFLDGTSQGALTIAGTYQGSNSSATFLNGTITNTGTILLNSTGNFTDLLIADGTTLTGGGSLILSDSPNNRIWGTTNSGAETLTNVNNTISGAGQIGVSNSIEFINQSAGVINATSSTNALVISPTTNSTLVSANGGGFVNQGLLEATAAGGLILNGGQFNNTGGVILADGVTSQVLINNSTSVTGGTLRTINGGNFSIGGSAAVDQITGTLGTITVTSAGALSAVNGINFNGVNGGPGGTLSLSAPSVTFGTGTSDINGALFNGGDATGPSSPGGDGGNFTVTATSGDITVGSDIEASTGANGSSVSTGGTGGTVNLTANNGQVTVNNRIQVSHNSGSRKSAAGGNINITSGKTSGVAINVSSSGQLLALLAAAAPGPGGKITIMATSPTSNSSSVNINGTVQADRGTVDIEHAGDNGQINLTNADVRADIVKIGALGTNGTLSIGGGTLSADTTLKLYAPGSNGIVNFIADVTLSGASTKIIAGDTVNIFNSVVVAIGGLNPASVYTNHANYTGFGGNGSRTGTFAGAGANSPQPLPSAPPFGP